MSRYLVGVRNLEQETVRGVGAALVPVPAEPLRGLGLVKRDLVAFARRRSTSSVATLDVVATLLGTHQGTLVLPLRELPGVPAVDRLLA